MANGVIDTRFLDENGQLLPEVKKFNWGAFFATWIWGICHGSYITLIIFVIPLIPIINIFGSLAAAIFFGIKGNEWALQNKEWQSIEHFNHVQKLWATWSIIIGLFLNITVIGVVAALTIPSVILNTNKTEYMTGHKKAKSVLYQAVMLEYADKDRVDLSSGEAFAKVLYNRMNSSDIKGNKIKTTDDMTYSCECSNGTSCIVTVDVNGEKGPNELTKDAKNPKDIIKFKVVKKQGNGYEVLSPKWFDQPYK